MHGTRTEPPLARGQRYLLFGSCLLSEDLDGLTLGERDDGLLPRAGLACDIADALRLRLHPHGVDLHDMDVEELLDSVGNLLLRCLGSNLEGVLALLHEVKGTLGDDRADDHVVLGVHLREHLLEVLRDSNRHDQCAIVDQVLRVGLGLTDHEDIGEVAKREVARDILVVDDDGHALAVKAESLDHSSCSLRGRLLECNVVQKDELGISELAGEDGAHCELDFLLVRAACMAVGRRSEDNAAADHLRSADGALASTAGALLAERLDAAAGNGCAVLGGVGALATACSLDSHDLVHDRDVGLDAVDGISQLCGRDRFTCHILYIDAGHLSSLLA
jgi:hypothetical protein